MNADDTLRHYLLFHDLRGSTETYYSRITSAYRTANGDDISSRRLSEWLGKLKDAGRSDYYRRSVRNGLGALLRFHGDKGPIRPVRVGALENDVWSPIEVRRLIDAASSTWWKSLIDAAWTTGLSGVDLLRLDRSHCRGDRVVTRRSKTGRLVACWIRPETLMACPAAGRLFPWQNSGEWFRKCFKKIAKIASLDGSFKKLRRSAAAEVERKHPEQAHRFLANTRKVCELHYLPAELLTGIVLSPDPMG